MENKGLLFIPDISGFTRFVNKVDIEHGRLIIQELLEIAEVNFEVDFNPVFLIALGDEDADDERLQGQRAAVADVLGDLGQDDEEQRAEERAELPAV